MGCGFLSFPLHPSPRLSSAVFLSPRGLQGQGWWLFGTLCALGGAGAQPQGGCLCPVYVHWLKWLSFWDTSRGIVGGEDNDSSSTLHQTQRPTPGPCLDSEDQKRCLDLLVGFGEEGGSCPSCMGAHSSFHRGFMWLTVPSHHNLTEPHFSPLQNGDPPGVEAACVGRSCQLPGWVRGKSPSLSKINTGSEDPTVQGEVGSHP